MKNLILPLMLIISVIASAQDTATVEQYCRMIISPRALSTKVNIDLDFGEERKLFAGDTRLRDEMTGKLKKFNSIVDALNYMGAQGWSLINAFPTGQVDTYQYYFRKRFAKANIE